MKEEIEVRLLNINKDELINKLTELKAEFVGDWIQKRFVYDFNPKIENKWIRLRTNGEETTLTIKHYMGTNVGDTKELEIIVSDFEKTNLILNELGYKHRSVQENRRIRYILDGVEIDIDKWPHLNTYVEFESDSLEKIKNVMKKLALDYNETTTKDAQDIYLDEGFTLDDLNCLKLEDE